MTTHPEQLDIYDGDQNHWQHVLENLLIPAAAAAQFEAIPPDTRGGDVIHRGIMRNLSETDLVLCDMSGLNANVFFELGIRTALNKPVAAIVDDKSHPVPFDAGVAHYHRYSSDLRPWTIESQIKKLADFLIEVDGVSKGANSMWTTFGIERAAQLFDPKAAGVDKMDLIMNMLGRLTAEQKQQIQPSNPVIYSYPKPAVNTQQDIEVADPLHQSGTIKIEVLRETFFATGSGRLEPRMNGVPRLNVTVVSRPDGLKDEELIIKPGTGTTYDFNVSIKSFAYGKHLPLGEYVFNYEANVEYPEST